MSKPDLDLLLEYLQEDKVVPKSDKDWELVRHAASDHLVRIMKALGPMISDEGDSLEDTLSHHYNILMPHNMSVKKYLILKLIKNLEKIHGKE